MVVYLENEVEVDHVSDNGEEAHDQFHSKGRVLAYRDVLRAVREVAEQHMHLRTGDQSRSEYRLQGI